MTKFMRFFAPLVAALLVLSGSAMIVLRCTAPAHANSVVRSWTPKLIWLNGFNIFKTNHAIQSISLMSSGRVIFTTVNVSPNNGTTYTVRVVDCYGGRIVGFMVAPSLPKLWAKGLAGAGIHHVYESIYTRTSWAVLSRVACAVAGQDPEIAGNYGHEPD